MSEPRRIQRQRTKGWRMPEDAVYVGRPSQWGNPYPLGTWCAPKALPFFESVVDDEQRAVDLFTRWLAGDPHVPLSGHNRHRQPPTAEEIRADLAGKDLACWCSLDKPCHADVLIEIANSVPSDTEEPQ